MLGCDSAMAGAATAPTATPAAACLRNDLRFIKALLSLFWFAWQSICPRNLSRFASGEQAGGSRVVHPRRPKVLRCSALRTASHASLFDQKLPRRPALELMDAPGISDP